MSYKKPMLVIFEGIDGTGKTTLMEAFKTALHDDGATTKQVRAIGEGPIGGMLRGLLMDRQHDLDDHVRFKIFTTAIRDCYENHILPAIKNTDVIVMDRNELSTLAYQGFEYIDYMVQHLQPSIDKVRQYIDIHTVYLTASKSTLQRRASDKANKQENDLLDDFAAQHQAKLLARYDQALKILPEVIRLDTTDKSPEELVSHLMNILLPSKARH